MNSSLSVLLGFSRSDLGCRLFVSRSEKKQPGERLAVSREVSPALRLHPRTLPSRISRGNKAKELQSHFRRPVQVRPLHIHFTTVSFYGSSNFHTVKDSLRRSAADVCVAVQVSSSWIYSAWLHILILLLLTGWIFPNEQIRVKLQTQTMRDRNISDI